MEYEKDRPEDDVDEEEEEEDDSEEDMPLKKKKKSRNMFLDVEAEVDENDDEYDEPEDDENLLNEEFIADDELAEDNDNNELYESRLKYTRAGAEQFDPEAEEQRLKMLYGSQDVYKPVGVESSNVPQQFLLPTVNDPKLWMVKCKVGKEQEIVFNLLRKYFANEYSGNPLAIRSAITRENLKGYVYIEAYKQAHVQQAIDKMNNVYSNKITLVPTKEMTDILTVTKKEFSIKPDAWVRVKRGKYAGDLAQIIHEVDTGETVRIRLVPRLEIFANEVEEVSAASKRKKSTVRPLARLFNHQEVQKRDPSSSITKNRGYWMYKGESFKDGFLEKEVKIASLDVNGIQPTLEEISKFSAESPQLLNLVSSSDDFEKGDAVQVIEGDLINLKGIVSSIVDDIVKVDPIESDLQNTLTFKSSQLKKFFKTGEHVKVVNGQNKGEKGLIVKIEDRIVTLFSDLTMNEIKCFSKDLRAVKESSSTILTSNPTHYEVLDFVQLDPQNVGVIVKIDGDMFTILDQNGTNRLLKLQEISQKRDSRKAISNDANANEIKASDIVQVLSGPFERKTGSILHLYRSWAFLKSNDHLENSGVYVVRTNNITLVGSTNSKKDKFPAPQGLPQFNSNKTIRASYGGKKDEYLAKNVTVSSGPFKGYKGIVKEVQGSSIRVELHTKNKTISIDKSKVILGDTGGMSADRGAFDRDSNYAGYRTPMGSQTPMWESGSRTPAYDAGSRTPSWDPGSRTPAYDPGSRTPAWEPGSKTPAYESGSKTPAWEPSSKTPAYDYGGRTPSWESANKTPGYSYDNEKNSVKTPSMTHESSSKYESSKTPRNDKPFTPGPSDNIKTPYDTATTPAYETPGYSNYPSSTTPYTGTPGPKTNTATYSTDNRDSSFFERSADWVTDSIEVQIMTVSHNGQRGIIRKVNADKSCVVDVLNSKEKIQLYGQDLQPVMPMKKDRVKCIRGEFVGKTGTLFGLDGLDGIVKLDETADFKIMNINMLSKLATQ